MRVFRDGKQENGRQLYLGVGLEELQFWIYRGEMRNKRGIALGQAKYHSCRMVYGWQRKNIKCKWGVILYRLRLPSLCCAVNWTSIIKVHRYLLMPYVQTVVNF